MGIALMTDGAHLSICWRNIAPGSLIDYARFIERIEAELGDSIVEAYCFDATENGATEPRFRAMEHAGIRVKLYSYSYEPLYDKLAKPLIDPSTGMPATRRIQKGVDVGLAMHMLASYERCKWNKLALVASDADFAEPVHRLVENHNVELTLIGISGRTSHSLVPYASKRLDLRDLAASITRPVINLRAC